MTTDQQDDDESHGIWLLRWWHHVWESLPACVFLVALSVLVHPYLESDSFVEWMTRQLASVVYEAKLSPDIPTAEATVFKLDSVSSRALEETRPLSADLIGRYRGDRPLDRCKAAKLLASLAEEAARAEFINPHAPKVLAIDFDVAPLLLEPDADPRGASHGCPLNQQIDNMVKALDALRQRFDVVIVVPLPRPAGIEREKRREFLQRAHCTGAPGSAVGPATACGLPGKLYVASALLHASPQNIISQYLNERKSDTANSINATFGQGPDGLSHGDLPQYFPSLGRLMGFASRKDCAASPVTESEKSTLESQCVVANRAGQNSGDAALTQEAVGGDDPHSVGEHLNKLYSRAYIDWSTTSDGRIGSRGLQLLSPAVSASSGAIASIASIALDPTTLSNFKWPNVILLSVNTGANSDKHVTSSGDPAMSGAKIHAAVATSKLIRLAEVRAAALADLFAGLAFAAIWSAWGLKVGALPGGEFAPGLTQGGATQTPWRGLSGLVIALLVLAVVTGTALLVLGVSPPVAWDIAQAAPHLGYGLLAIGFGLSASAVIWVDGVGFGQNGLPLEKMVWLSRSVRQMLPLALGTLIALTAVATSLASLLSTAGGRFFDVKVMLIGLMLHVYMEANHNGVVNADHSWLKALGKSRKLLAAGWAAGSLQWLDTLLRWLLWVAVLSGAMGALVFASH